ncbi:unnamed protein product [Medioppia subpectinata]|uniref:MOSC domain-containing protein n=1 Tax=Medioppia subpectinata TaxID=1979941 RepID=A0A7R9PYJ0_9ACAR|nr:unnamed protein product [Medioppia subpectinata]CAG2105123.1 unnamed protein product [Medioppia subpectinata]
MSPPLYSSLNVSNIVLSSALLFAITGALVYAVRKATKRHRNYVKVAKVCKLIVYPIKSLPGVEVDRLDVTIHGSAYGPFRDRSWLLVDNENRMITQRTEGCSKLAMLTLQFRDNQLWVDGPNMTTLKLNVINKANNMVINTSVFGDAVDGIYCGKEAEDYFSAYLDKEGTKLIQHTKDMCGRQGFLEVNGERLDRVSKYPILYHDNSGLLVINQSSIDDLNGRLPADALSTTYRNFRPNILISECQAFDEDNWAYVRVGCVHFSLVKPMDRCIFTTIDPNTGRKDGVEPLKTLRSYRLASDKLRKTYGTSPLFGAGIGAETEGQIQCGDDLLAVWKQ